MALELVSTDKCFNGFQNVYKHFSSETNSSMNFSLYLPAVSEGEKLHCLFYLPGNGYTEQDFIEKSGFQRYASEYRFIVAGPDTSPRGFEYAKTGDWNFGEGAGYYMDTLKEPWSKNFRMYSYITKELLQLVKDNFPVTGTFGIFGHSIGGGTGAIAIGLRNPDIFKSISAFAPICNPIDNIYARKQIFGNYLGLDNRDEWKLYDATEVTKVYNGPHRDILIDQGTRDELASFTVPENLQAAAAHKKDVINLRLNMREGYNHSYYFVATFIGDHFAHHAKILNALCD